MTPTDQKIIDASIAQVRGLHENISTMWDGETRAMFYYSVLAGTIARHGPEVAQAITAMLTEVYGNTARSHADLGKLANGFANGKTDEPTETRATE